jgi:GTPase SAR1 family protein
MRFSERMGYKTIKNTIQKESMDDDLRNSLWNEFIKSYPYKLRGFYKKIWSDFFKKPQDIGIMYDEHIKNHILTANWFEVYDLIEFIPNNCIYSDVDPEVNFWFIENCNSIFERELSAYRFVDGNIMEITSEEEINSIDQAIENSPSIVETHLKKAVSLLSDRKNPDFSNSIKESISAVESICKLIVDDEKTTLGRALEKIERESKIELHHSLKESFKKLYSYTSDADGIRHALKEDSNLSYEDAKFMLVSCSAFTNYLIVKASKSGIELDI